MVFDMVKSIYGTIAISRISQRETSNPDVSKSIAAKISIVIPPAERR